MHRLERARNMTDMMQTRQGFVCRKEKRTTQNQVDRRPWCIIFLRFFVGLQTESKARKE